MPKENPGSAGKELDYAGRGVPLMPNRARQIIADLFEQRAEWSRQELSEWVARIHQQNGGLEGKQKPSRIVKKALYYLQSDGAIEKTGAKGYWRKRGTPVTGAASEAPDEGVVSDPAGEDEGAEEVSQVRTIGEGSEWVYLYYYQNDRELAQHRGEDVWECKVGQSARYPPERIFAQGAKTARPHPPVFGLFLKTPDSPALERALHMSLRLTEAAVPESEGDEWFITNPERVERWFLAYQRALSELEGGMVRPAPDVPPPGQPS